MSASTVTASVSTDDTGTDWLRVPAGVEFDIFPGDGGDATITLQRRDPNDTSSVYDVKAYASTDEPEIGLAAATWDYRLYCKTSNYTSGPIAIGLWKP